MCVCLSVPVCLFSFTYTNPFLSLSHTHIYTQVFPIFVFGFTCQQNIFSIVNEIENPTIGRVNKVIVGSIGTAVVTYLAVAACGYATYGSLVESDVSVYIYIYICVCVCVFVFVSLALALTLFSTAITTTTAGAPQLSTQRAHDSGPLLRGSSGRVHFPFAMPSRYVCVCVCVCVCVSMHHTY